MSENRNGQLKSKRYKISNEKEQIVPVVGIGASAGGLEAIKKLLENLPLDTGLAFVIIQHLVPNQESMLSEILTRVTKLPVNQVESGMPIKPDHIYVIPSGKTMTINKEHLELQPKERTALKPIDLFLNSLALEKKTRAIAIILSGTGTDGTEGIKKIKSEGGITFAQEPKTAQYPDMPKSAIASESVYFVLSPEKIAEKLAIIAKHPEISHKKIEEPKLSEENETDLQTIFTILKKSSGVNFANYKKGTVNRRISRRMVLNKIEKLKKYVVYLRAHPEEHQSLFNDLLINVTTFFREPNTFVVLKEKVFPEIFKQKQSNAPLRVWVPGCSTGEEVYSIASTLTEFIEENNLLDAQLQIFGTDVNGKNIEKARRGIYDKAIEDNVSEIRLKRFFTKSNGNYQIIKQIRDICVFAKHDIARDPPFSNLDIIICRNLLIYFETQLQERILPAFNYSLKTMDT